MTKQAGLDKRVMEFITADKDGISVDWKRFADFSQMQGYEGRRITEQVNNELIDFLRSIGFLVPAETKGSYAVTGDGILGGNIGPGYENSSSAFNFAGLESAREYKGTAGKLEGKAVLPAHIVQVID